MRNALIFMLCLCWTVQAKAQTSIYDCGIYPPVTQAAIENAGAEFNLPCVILDQQYDFNGGSGKIISSPTSIHVLPGFHAGAYNAFGTMHLRINPKAEFDVTVMNYGSLEHILRYEKFELGIGLPASILKKVNNFVTDALVPASEMINPFLEWKIRIIATFTHPATGTKQVVDGFYTRELERDSIGNTWTDVGTDHPFRIRFAPPLNGEWKCKVNISIDNIPTYESSGFPIQVIESGNPGFTKVHANKKNLMRGDEIIFPVGTNLPFDGGTGSEYMQWTFNPNHVRDYPMSFWKRYVDSVDSYGKKGGQFIRVINAPASGEIEFEKLGNYYDRLKFATEMDKLIEVCHTNGTLIDFCLMYHTPLMTSADYTQWAWDYGAYWPNTFADTRPVYCYSSAFNSTEPHDMIMNDEAFKYMKQRYRYYISRYGYSTNVYMFEIANEPWHLDQHTAIGYEPYKLAEGDIVRTAVTKMNTELSKYIKEHLKHGQHLIAALGYLTEKYPNGTPRLVNDESWFAENIDIIGMNHYESRPDKMIISKDHRPYIDDNNGFFADENSYAHSFHKLFEIYNKPIVLTEHGHTTSHDNCSNYLGNTIDPMRLGFTGVAGFNMWAGWDFVKNQSKLWPHVIRSQQHMNGVDVIRTLSNENGNWLQGREIQKNKELVEHQYYISNNKESCVGYVYNRTCNVKSNGCPGYSDLLDGLEDPLTIYPNDHNMEIQGLKNNTDYMVDWYSYETGQYMSSECYNSSIRGRISLEHPNLPPWIPSNNPTFIEFPELLPVFGYKESPLVWYVVKQQNCHGGKSMSQGNPESPNNISIESNGKDKLRVSPNPFNSELTIEADDEIGLITITDSKGTIIRQEHFFSKSAVINTYRLSSGVYFIYNQKGNNAYKIIKL